MYLASDNNFYIDFLSLFAVTSLNWTVKGDCLQQK